MASNLQTKNLALQFGRIRHFNEGLSEFSRQLGLHVAGQARRLREDFGWRFHFILPAQWHGMFGDDVLYRCTSDLHRYWHLSAPQMDVWHGLHQHMRFRPPLGSRFNLMTLHDLNHVYVKQGVSRWWQDRRLQAQMRGLDRIVAISEHVRQDIAAQLPWAPPTEVIYNGVANLANIKPCPIESLTAKPYFLHISRMSSSKNVESLIRLAAVWPEQLFVMAGPCSQETERHQASVQSMGLNNVEFHLDVSEGQKTWLYQNCQAFFFPSLLEGFGLPPIEAMSFGKPLFVAARSSLPEVCGNGAVYWNDFDPMSMKKIVQENISNWSNKARNQAQVVQRYSWLEAGRRYIDLYSKALQ